MTTVRACCTTGKLSKLVKEFGGSSSGGALLEYALSLALLVGSGLAAYAAVAAGADRVFKATALVMGSEAGSVQTSSTAGTANRSSGVVGTPSDGLARIQALIARVAVAIVGIVVWVATMAGGFFLWRVLRRRLRLGRAMPSSGQPVLAPLSPGAQDQLFEKRQQIRRLISRNLDGSPGFETQVGHLMSKCVVTIRPGVSPTQAAESMKN